MENVLIEEEVPNLTRAVDYQRDFLAPLDDLKKIIFDAEESFDSRNDKPADVEEEDHEALAATVRAEWAELVAEGNVEEREIVVVDRVSASFSKICIMNLGVGTG